MVLGPDLVPHDVQGFDAGADEGDACGFERAGKVDVLAEEAVAGVYGLGAGVAAGPDDGTDVQVAFRGGCRADPHGTVGFAHVPGAGIGIAVDGHGRDAERTQGADHAAGDLPAVGHEDRLEQRLMLRAGWYGGRRNGHDGLTSGTGRRRSPAAGCGRRRRAPIPGRCGCQRGRSRRRPRGGRWNSTGCPGPRTAA